MDSGSSSRQERYARARHAYAAAARRDPRAAGCGYVAADPATGAVGSFVWFPTAAETFAFLAGPEVDLLGFGPDEERRIVASLRRVLRGVGSLGRVDRALVSACFDGWTEILWLGSFGELCGRGGGIPVSTRAEFRRVRGLGEHAGPVADDELDAFVAFLRTLGG